MAVPQALDVAPVESWRPLNGAARSEACTRREQAAARFWTATALLLWFALRRHMLTVVRFLPRAVGEPLLRHLLAYWGTPAMVVGYDLGSGETRTVLAVLPDGRRAEYSVDWRAHMRPFSSAEPADLPDITYTRGTSRESRPRPSRGAATSRAGPSDDPDPLSLSGSEPRLAGPLGVVRRRAR